MNRHVVVATVLVAGLTGMGVVDAAPRASCKLLGAGKQTTEIDENEPAAKITSADVGSNSTHLTGVVRLGSITEPIDLVGREISFYFSRGDNESFVLQGKLWGTTPASFRVGRVPGAYGGLVWEEAGGHVDVVWLADKVTGIVDTVRNELRMTVPMKTFAGTSLKRGARVTYLGAEIYRLYGPSPSTLPDPTWGPPRRSTSVVGGGPKIGYVLGAPTCVPVGR